MEKLQRGGGPARARRGGLGPRDHMIGHVTIPGQRGVEGGEGHTIDSSADPCILLLSYKPSNFARAIMPYAAG